MTSRLFTLVFLVLTFFTATAQTDNGIPLPRKATTERADSPADPLRNLYQSSFFYNPDSTLNHEVEDTWDLATNTWIHYNQYFYSNNPDGRLAELLRQWISTDDIWKSDFRRLYTYYPDPNYLNGQAKIQVSENWNGSAWETSFIQTLDAYGPGTGDLEGEIAQSKYEGFVQGVKAYGGTTNYTIIALPNGIRTTEIDRFNFNATLGIDDPSYKEIYIYNDPTSLQYDTVYSFGWLVDSSAWATTPSSRTIQSISGHQTIQLSQSLSNGTWVNYSRTISVSDNSDFLLTYVSETWQEATASFSEDFKLIFDYNLDHSVATLSIFTVDFLNSSPSLYLSERITSEYGPALVGTHSPMLLAGVKVFPNPVVDFVQISLDNYVGKQTNCTLINAKGIVAGQIQTAGNTATFSLAGQPAGIYFLRVEQDGAVMVVPVIKH